MNLSKDLLISAEKDVRSSSVYLAYLVLKRLDQDARITIFELYTEIKKHCNTFNYADALYSLIFLYMLGLIKFHEPYIYLNETPHGED